MSTVLATARADALCSYAAVALDISRGLMGTAPRQVGPAEVWRDRALKALDQAADLLGLDTTPPAADDTRQLAAVNDF